MARRASTSVLDGQTRRRSVQLRAPVLWGHVDEVGDGSGPGPGRVDGLHPVGMLHSPVTSVSVNVAAVLCVSATYTSKVSSPSVGLRRRIW